MPGLRNRNSYKEVTLEFPIKEGECPKLGRNQLNRLLSETSLQPRRAAGGGKLEPSSLFRGHFWNTANAVGGT
jgi:hypothetical protein